MIDAAASAAVPIIALDMIDSTNDEAKRRLAAGALTAPCAITAAGQTAGRGTQGRTWASPRGAGLYLSYAHPGPIPVAPDDSGAFTLAAGVACAEALERRLDLDVRLKPVNDLHVGGRKLGGILAESVAAGTGVRDLVIGVGVNLRRAERHLDGRVDAVSIEELVDPMRWSRVDAADLVSVLLSALAARVRQVIAGDRAAIEAAWNERSLQPSSRELQPAVQKLRRPDIGELPP